MKDWTEDRQTVYRFLIDRYEGNNTLYGGGNSYVKVSLVADETGIAPNTLTQLFDKLEDEGLVSKWTDNSRGITWEINYDAVCDAATEIEA